MLVDDEGVYQRAALQVSRIQKAEKVAEKAVDELDKYKRATFDQITNYRNNASLMADKVYEAEALINTINMEFKKQDYRLTELRSANHYSQKDVGAGAAALTSLKEKHLAAVKLLKSKLQDATEEARQVARLQAQVAKLEKAADSAKEEYRRVAAEKVELLSKRAEIEADAVIAASGMQAKIDSLNNTVLNFKSEVLTLTREVKARDLQVAAAEKRVRALEKEVEQLVAVNTGLTNKNTQLHAKVKSLVAQIKVLRNQLNQERKPVPRLSAESKLAKLRAQIGLRSNESFPAPTARGQSRASQMASSGRQFRMLTAVIKGRGAHLIVRAVIKSNGRSALTALSNTRQMQPVIKAHVKESLDVLQRRLDAKHALFCLLFLNLSRSNYSTLRNSISYQYNPEIDTYDKLNVWVNKFDENDVLTAPAMASWWMLTKERDNQYKGCNVLESDDGNSCERDVELVWQAMYMQYHRIPPSASN